MPQEGHRAKGRSVPVGEEAANALIDQDPSLVLLEKVGGGVFGYGFQRGRHLSLYFFGRDRSGKRGVRWWWNGGLGRHRLSPRRKYARSYCRFNDPRVC